MNKLRTNQEIKTLIKSVIIIIVLISANIITNLMFISEKIYNDLLVVLSTCTIISIIMVLHKVSKWIKEIYKYSIIYSITIIISVAAVVCPINTYLFINVENSFESININNYASSIVGAIHLTMDMMHYAIGNTVFGCSYIVPSNTFSRCVATIQSLISYIVIIKGIIDNQTNKLEQLIMKQAEKTTELTKKTIELCSSMNEHQSSMIKSQNTMSAGIETLSNGIETLSNGIETLSNRIDMPNNKEKH